MRLYCGEYGASLTVWTLSDHLKICRHRYLKSTWMVAFGWPMNDGALQILGDCFNSMVWLDLRQRGTNILAG